MKKIIAISLLLVLIVSALCLVGCNTVTQQSGLQQQGDNTVVSIGASSVPHAEILTFASDILQEEHNIELDIKVMDDYVIPNTGLSSGDLYANYFQHIPYMTGYNDSITDNKIASIIGVHLEPLGIYSGGKATAKTLDGIKAEEGTKKIAITNDQTNQKRALDLLVAQDIISVKGGVDNASSVDDYDWGSYDVVTIDPETLVVMGLPDCHLAVIPGNFALTGGVSGALVTEDPQDDNIANNYVNVVAVRADCKDSEVSQALAEVLSSVAVANFIAEKYNGAVIPVTTATNS